MLLLFFFIIVQYLFFFFFFFFNDTATTEIYTLSLHDALPISFLRLCAGKYARGMRLYHVRLGKEVRVADALTFMAAERAQAEEAYAGDIIGLHNQDRKSTRLNSSHLVISYAVFCLKKKKI